MPISNPSMPSVPDGLHVDDLTLDETGLLITARTTAAHASCRVCGRASVRVHSRYWRTFNDLPWYGTIVCDLERHRVPDLLPGRSAAPVRDWLAAYPSVSVVSRDRSGPYAEAARTGAPQARQVADRWHLLVNASEALRAVVERHQREIQEVASCTAHGSSAPSVPMETAPTSTAHGRRRDRCEMTLRLRCEGLPIREIARRVGASRNAVRRWARAGRFVPYRRAGGCEPARPPSPFRRGALAGRPAQRHRPLSRAARAGLHGRVRYRPALGCATTNRRAGPTAVGSDPLDAAHHPVADHLYTDSQSELQQSCSLPANTPKPRNLPRRV